MCICVSGFMKTCSKIGQNFFTLSPASAKLQASLALLDPGGFIEEGFRADGQDLFYRPVGEGVGRVKAVSLTTKTTGIFSCRRSLTAWLQCVGVRSDTEPNQLHTSKVGVQVVQ